MRLIILNIGEFWWLFLGLAIVLLGVSVFYRIQYLILKGDIIKRKAVAKLRFKAAKDLSDELSNSFNNIRIITKECDIEKIEESQKSIGKIEKLCGESIELMEDVIWATKTETCTIEDLMFKFEDYMDDVLRSKKIPIEIKVDNLPMERRLGFFRRRNYLLIFKEAINNIIYHTNPTKVEINILYKVGHFEMWIKNNYNQKLNPAYRAGVGIPKMRQQMEALGGSLEIKDSPGIFEVGAILTLGEANVS